MRPLTLIFLFVWAVSLKAQTNVYHPFPDSMASWLSMQTLCCTGYDPCMGPGFPNFPDIHYQFNLDTIIGDTIINSRTYQRVYRSEYHYIGGTWGAFNCITNLWFEAQHYIGGLRDSAQRIYFYPSQSFSELGIVPEKDTLLYDFNLTVGDTFASAITLGQYVITSIDSILIGNNYRKRLNASESQNLSIIEGIGATSGLLWPMYWFEGSGYLWCFKNYSDTNTIIFSDSQFYPDSVIECNFPEELTNVSIEDLSKKLGFNIFPNPTQSQITIEQLTVHSSQLFVEICNPLGQIVYQSSEPFDYAQGDKRNTTIDVSGFAKGVYLLRVREKREVVFWEKLIVE